MRIRRCAVLWLEPRETVHFELEALLSGGTGVVSVMRWFAHAPHLASALEVSAEVAVLLGELSPSDWIDDAPLRTRLGAACIRMLLRSGVLVGRGKAWAAQRETDERLRGQHWHGLSSVSHAASRWDGIDAAGEVAEAGMGTALGLRTKYGPPPPTLHHREGPGGAIVLQRPERTSLDDLLDTRGTCRNFDTTRALPQAPFSHLLQRVFGARGRVHAAEDFDVIKRTSPSGGALHPTEAYLIVRKVEGIAAGLYHYQAGDHALQPLAFDAGALVAAAGRHPVAKDKSALDYLAWIAVGGQQWFADAHVLVVLASRFARNFWKYRNHPKAYRVAILDVGHLSQTLLLTATEFGLGSYVTAAINEVDIERAFGLTHYVEGPLAVCGFGPRKDTMSTSELDPNGKVWPRLSRG
jgi:putative peptide maturation dehydrogenase